MPDIDAIHGAAYAFGLRDSDVSGLSIPGFTARKVSSDAEPEVFQTATNGEGHVEAVAITAPTSRKLTAQLTGYISTSFNKLSVPNTFGLFSRNFFVTKISEPRNKGEFVEVTIEGTSFKLVAS